ncbi:hypothetical protein MACK_000474 [Theileria orientalis]|uniref:Uncharacterized protein n=1 Tax=Theileria orientalis TaxID=68886 RepID=A0A976MA10_THEOR|nr:hypothetical protein MACK_000474 [Theileria orientalis]
MKIRRILRKICMFLVGINLIQPLRLFLDSSNYMFEKFKVPLEEMDRYLSRGNLLMAILSGIGTILVCFYLTLLSPKLGINHFNKLLTIITNWIVMIFDLVILIIFTIGGQAGYFKVFFFVVVASTFMFGVNEAFLLIVDPVNIPFFLLGVSCSAFQVVIYHLIYVACGTGESLNNFKIVLGQIIISFVLSVIVVGLCNYSYGGKTLFNIVGIHRLCDFILDNSSKRLFDDYRKVSKYKKFLNEEIISEIKNLEYEIILRFNIKTNYRITNIIQRANRSKNTDMKAHSSHGNNANNSGNNNNNNRDSNANNSNHEVPEESRDERVKIGVKVTSLRYENMMQGLEIYRHEVEKDVKLSRIKGEFTDIDVNLFHFKYADVYTKDKLTLINVVTVQFSSSNDFANNIDTSFANSDPSESNGKNGNHNGNHKGNNKNKYKGLQSDKEGEELGVYEMNYYFFVVHDRMYQYKPSENEWVHPVELLLSLVNLHKRSLQGMNIKHSVSMCKKVNKSIRKFYYNILCWKKNKRVDEYDHYTDFNYNYDDELGMGGNQPNAVGAHNTGSHGVNRLSTTNNVQGVGAGAIEANSNVAGHSANELDNSPNDHPTSPKHMMINNAAEEELCNDLRGKLVMLFLNNKLRWAIKGAVLPLTLNVVTMVSLFMSFPMMGIYDDLEPDTAIRFEMVIKIVSIIPGVLICVVCTVGFLKNLSMQKPWHKAHNYVYLSYLTYIVVCFATLMVTKKKDDIVSNNAFVLVMSLIIVVTFQINTITSFTSIMFQKSSKLDYLTLNYLDNNIKTNVQLMSFNLLLFHLVRLIYLAIYKNYTNRLFKLLYWVI